MMLGSSTGLLNPRLFQGPFKGIEHLFTEKLTDDGFIIKQMIKPGSGAIIPSRAWVRSELA